MTKADRPAAPVSKRTKRPSKAQAARAKKAKRREDMLDMVVSGCDRAAIAWKYGVSLATVRREVDRAIDQRRLDAPARYVRLQVERLTKALQTVDRAIEEGDLASVDPLVKLVTALDRYHGLAGALALPPPHLPAPKALALAQGAAPMETKTEIVAEFQR